VNGGGKVVGSDASQLADGLLGRADRAEFGDEVGGLGVLQSLCMCGVGMRDVLEVEWLGNRLFADGSWSIISGRCEERTRYSRCEDCGCTFCKRFGSDNGMGSSSSSHTDTVGAVCSLGVLLRFCSRRELLWRRLRARVGWRSMAVCLDAREEERRDASAMADDMASLDDANMSSWLRDRPSVLAASGVTAPGRDQVGSSFLAP
jgi:hypothetical protein